jgi:hypothetical protein
MQINEEYGDQTLVMNRAQKILLTETNKYRNLEARNEAWYQKEFWDDTYKKRYEDDFLFYKRLNKNYNNIQFQIMRFFHVENQRFIAECLDDLLHVEWKHTMNNLWIDWRIKRWKLNARTKYLNECCWNEVLSNVKPELIGYETAQIKKGLKSFNIQEGVFLNWLQEMMA